MFRTGRRCKTVPKESRRKWKAVDGLICCAGIQEPIGPAMEMDPAAWRSTLAVNLDGTFFSIRAFYSVAAPARDVAQK